MADYTPEELRRIEAADAQKREDFADQQDAFAGRVNGRTQRFLNEDTREARKPSKRNARQQSEQLTRLQQLLASNSAYRQLYNDAMDQLRNAEQRTENEIERLNEILKQAQNELNSILDNAAQLSSGVKVFKDANGQVWTEHGVQVEGEALDEIVWREGNPSYEDYLSKSQMVTNTQNALNAWVTYQNETLGDIRLKMADERQPPKDTDIEKFTTVMRERMPNLPTAPDIQRDTAIEVHNSASVQLFKP